MTSAGRRITLRLLLFVGTFLIMLYALAPAVQEIGMLTGAVALGVAGLLLLGDVFVQALWRRVDRQWQKNHDVPGPNMDRRHFMASLAVPATAIAVGGVGLAGSTAMFGVRREEVRLRGLPQALDGFRIGLITDPHIGPWIAPERLAHAVDVLNDAQVDLHIMGGDLIDDLSLIEPTFAALERCRAPHGMIAILGNHEKMQHTLSPVLEAYEHRKPQGQIRLLVDDHLRLEHRGAAFSVVGVDYPMHHGGSSVLPPQEHQAFMQASAEKAFHGIRADEPVLCLSHHPDFFPIAADRGAWLTLAGHTHGGQWALFGRPLFPAFKYIRGRYRRDAAHLYVSCGLGDWLPCRIGVPHEVTILTLVRS